MTSKLPSNQSKQQSPVLKSTCTVLRLLLWLFLRSSVILFNKWLLSPSRFPYPVTLSFWHTLFCSAVGLIAVQCSFVLRQNVSWATYLRFCMPVAALGAAGLMLGNAAFVHLRLAFAQMLKANSPVIMFIVGCCFHTHTFSWETCGIMVIIGAGVAVSCLEELQFSSGLGATIMLLAILADAVKMALLQTMMQRTELEINPVNGLYYLMPASTLCLLPIMLVAEARKLYSRLPDIQLQVPALIASAVVACFSNVILFWVISNTSAVAMKLASVVKDAILVVVSDMLLGTHLTVVGMGGYIVALLGIGTHNYRRQKQSQYDVTDTRSEEQFLCKSESRSSIHMLHQNVGAS
ncbi:TPA: hypothetical protein ACH3X2_001197 [Trebouxia sp. C0005]